jgi:hypothetical protein
MGDPLKRAFLLMIPLLAVGCSSKTPEEVEAAKYPPPSNMMSEEEGRKFMAGQNDPRKGGAVPPRPPGEVEKDRS